MPFDNKFERNGLTMLNVKPSRTEIVMVEGTSVGVRKRLERSALSVLAARFRVALETASVRRADGRYHR